METTWMIQAGVAMAVIGLFAAAWFRFSRPARVLNGKDRVAPQLSPSPSAVAVAVATVTGDGATRRSPSL